jgi:hypothetical protein
VLIRKGLIALPVLVAVWIGTLALVMRLGGPAPGAFVPFPPAAMLNRLPQDIAVIDRTAVSLTFKADRPDLVARLYEAGAWIVLPAGLQACIPNILRQDPATVRDVNRGFEVMAGSENGSKDVFGA